MTDGRALRYASIQRHLFVIHSFIMACIWKKCTKKLPIVRWEKHTHYGGFKRIYATLIFMVVISVIFWRTIIGLIFK